jgi:chromate reductase
MRVLAISGSLKPTSTNSALLRAAAAMADASMRFTFFDQQLGDLPHFRPEQDEEGMTPTPPVASFRKLVAGCDGIVISCPEYAHGVPGSFKNALDWLVSSGEQTGKPTLLLMAGPGGAKQAWAALVPTLRVMGFDLVHESSLVVAKRHFDDDGRLRDAEIEAELLRGLDALAAALRARSV